MTGKTGVKIERTLGTERTPDGSLALIGVLTSEGQELALALGPDQVWPFATEAVAATALHHPSRQDLTITGPSFKPDWFKVGKTEGGSVAVEFRMPNSAALSFVIDPVMAERLLQTLGAALAPASMTPTDGTQAQ